MSPSLSAVVVAAGRSERFTKRLDPSDSSTKSKLLVTWNGKPLIRHTVEALFALPLNQMVIVARRDEFEILEDAFVGLPNRASIVFAEGGERRQDSVRSGLQALSGADFVLVHDGARPFIPADFLKSLFDRSLNSDGLVPAIPVVETLKEIDASGYVVRTVDRRSLVRVQTPQIFRYDLLRAAHESMKTTDKEFTDDASLMEYCGHRVRVVPGHHENIKVTLPEDLRMRGIRV